MLDIHTTHITTSKPLSRVGAVVRAFASHQCVPGSIAGPGVICGLSLLLDLYSAPRGFSPGTPVFPSHQKPTLLNSNSIWKQWMKSHLVEMPLQISIIIIIIITRLKLFVICTYYIYNNIKPLITRLKLFVRYTHYTYNNI